MSILAQKPAVLALFRPANWKPAETDYCLLITVYCLSRLPNRESAENGFSPLLLNRPLL